jgi:membrane protease YdiL (CAAX protease family)
MGGFVSDKLKKIGEVLLQGAGFFIILALLFQVLKFQIFEPFEIIRYSAALSTVWQQVLSLAAVLLVTLLFVGLFNGKKYAPRFTRQPGKDALLGVIIGVLLSGGTLGLYLMTESLTFSAWTFVNQFIFWVIAIGVNVLVQEYILRGYLFSLVQACFGDLAAVGFSAVIFAALTPYVLTGGVVAILIAFAFNFLLSLLRIHTKGLMGPAIVHFIWKITGVLILGTLPSRLGAPSVSAEDIAGAELLTGGNLRFAGSVLTLVITIFLIDLAFILISDAKEKAKK